MSLFKGIGSASSTGGGNNITPGEFKLELIKLYMAESKVAGGMTRLVAEFRVVEFSRSSDTMEIKVPGENGVTTKTVEAKVWKPGAALGHAIFFGGQHPEYALAETKELVRALVPDVDDMIAEAIGEGMSEDDAWEQAITEFISEDNPLAGSTCACSAWGDRSKNKNLPVVKKAWTAWSAE